MKRYRIVLKLYITSEAGRADSEDVVSASARLTESFSAGEAGAALVGQKLARRTVPD